MNISVIIPSYQPKDYIYKCIDSLSVQSLSKTKFEVIIVLNGEKDPYFSDISYYIKNLDNFKCVYNPIKGVSSARNLGLDLSKNATYIVFIDDDDYVSNNYLEVLFDSIKKSSSSIAQSNVKCDDSGLILEDYISKAYIRLKNKNYTLLSFRNFYSTIWGKIYDRRVINNIRFKENFKIAEDALFLFEISKNISNFVLTDDDCIYYRNIRIGSTIRSHLTTKTIIKNYINKIYTFSEIYFKSPLKYNFYFYLSRLVAITKVLIIDTKNKILA